MEDNGGDVAVVPEIDEFVSGVAVVGVDRGEAGLECSECRLEVFGAVVEVLGDLVLLGGSGDSEHRRGDAVGAPVHLGPADLTGPLLLGECVPEALGNRLPDVGEIPSRWGGI